MGRPLEIGVLIPPGENDFDGARAESAGFDVALYGDSPALLPDPYVRMAADTSVTRTIRLATGVTTPLTRQASVTAAAIASLQLASGGRAILGLGRGDSALAYIGEPFPVPLKEFERYTRAVKNYLAARAVEAHGYRSLLHWLPPGFERPPIDVSCSGPKTIALAARVADRVSVAVGAAPERLDWAVRVAKQARTADDSDTRVGEQRFGAWIVVVVADDLQQARAAIRGAVASVAQMAVMKGTRLADQPPPLKKAGAPLQDIFKLAVSEGRGRGDLSHLTRVAQNVSDELVEWYAVIGSPRHVAARLRSLAALGLDHIYLLFGSTEADAFLAASRDRFVAEVLPDLRG